MEVFIAGYSFRDEEEAVRWAQLEGGPLFLTPISACEAARLAGHATPEARPITVWKTALDWREDRDQIVRREATRKIWDKLTPEERKVLGL